MQDKLYALVQNETRVITSLPLNKHPLVVSGFTKQNFDMMVQLKDTNHV